MCCAWTSCIRTCRTPRTKFGSFPVERVSNQSYSLLTTSGRKPGGCLCIEPMQMRPCGGAKSTPAMHGCRTAEKFVGRQPGIWVLRKQEETLRSCRLTNVNYGSKLQIRCGSCQHNEQTTSVGAANRCISLGSIWMDIICTITAFRFLYCVGMSVFVQMLKLQ